MEMMLPEMVMVLDEEVVLYLEMMRERTGLGGKGI